MVGLHNLSFMIVLPTFSLFFYTNFYVILKTITELKSNKIYLSNFNSNFKNYEKKMNIRKLVLKSHVDGYI